MRFKLLAESVSRVFSLIFFLVLAQALGAEGYGRYAFPLAFSGLFLYFSDCGLNTLLIRELARYGQVAQRYIFHALILKVGLSLLTWGLILSAAWFSGLRNQAWEAVLWAGLITLAMGWLDLLSAIFNGLECIEVEISLRLQNRLLTLGSLCLILLWNRDVLLLLQGLALANGLSLLWGLAQTYKVLHQRQITFQGESWHWGFLGQLLRDGLPFWLSGLFALLYFRMDVAMLQLLGRPAVEVGWYQAVVKLLDLLVLLPNLLLMAVFPVLSQWGAERSPHQAAQMQALTRQALQWTWLVALPVTLGGGLLAEPMLANLLGLAFLPAVPFWQILLLSLLFIAINHVCLYALAALNLTRFLVWSSAGGVALNFALNLFWIPSLGGHGAAQSTVFTEIAVCVLNFWLLQKALALRVQLMFLFKAAGATLGMGLGVQLLHWLKLPWWVIVPLAIGLYALLLLNFKTLSPDQQRTFNAWAKAKLKAYTGKNSA